MEKLTVLSDFDGVICDTEAQYTEFWGSMGVRYLGIDNLGQLVKGQTLTQILEHYFDGREDMRDAIVPALNEFEEKMTFEYIPGAHGFLTDLKAAGIPTAIVTSSDRNKMAHVYRAFPELTSLVDAILVSEDFKASKPDPDCFIKGMERLGGKPEDTVVFEDSFHGITAGRAAGAHVIGLATTNPREAIAPMCDMVIDNFQGLDIDTLLKSLNNVKR